ncbi:DegT/DnrJ/EryC1/StrS family aminotransferase [Dactylosporangium sp. AC04546]|uniref:DegT/DnrJ/EryC1/StrS family aminotransferase n=1 Tax=Dactylosporangium sp. AC04546 TaxID=2862460 RepID=UPI001EDD669B|nr:DegT/DnrJ/EryC1/StrS family aminotransferase [Dactylosporangium sp. AC04546]WVK85096.1 DegT/DnrJ/EryC1/StrS family aminotransferase [Dactylosporangium sp. AC04546]
MRIPFNDLATPHASIVEEVVAEVRAVAANSRFIGGPAVEAFEQEFAAFCNTAHAVGVANGTDAIELTLRALGIGGGDEVLVPANTFIATASAVAAAGATPIFVDVDPESLLVTPETLEAGLTERTRAIVPVHLFGHMVPPAGVLEFAQRNNLVVVEDSAQAHGADAPNDGSGEKVRAGSYGVAGTFSFYPGKNLGAWGDGGAVVTDDADLASRIRSLANHGRTEGTDHYEHRYIGRNSRLDALQAMVLRRKLADLPEANVQRRRVASVYAEALAAHGIPLVSPLPGVDSAWHLLVVRVPGREAVRGLLNEAGIGTGVHYPVPCHRQLAYLTDRTPDLPVAERAATEILSLPFFPHMRDDEVAYVAENLAKAIATV